MTKAKQFLKKEKKKSKHVASAPETADEYLAAGVDFEEAGEKWRGGDAAKSMRFFVRATDCYDEALKKFPGSFDLAYNKARVQYELTQYPKLLAQLPGNLLGLLQTALESSRYALTLNRENPEVLFNTAQILTSLVEAPESTSIIDPLPLLEEALTHFHTCFSIQEIQATQSAQAQAQAESFSSQPDEEEGGVSLSDHSTSSTSAPSSPAEEEQWATVQEPVTNDTLLDTLIAQLETLTLLCSTLPPSESSTLSFIEKYAAPILNIHLPQYTSLLPSRASESALANANFISSFTDLRFRSQQLNLDTYYQTLTSTYSSLDLSTDPKGLCDAAESYISFNSSSRLYFSPASQDQIKQVLDWRWKLLSQAITNLTAASKLPDAENLASIHIARGDVELLRFQLGQGSNPYPAATQASKVLLGNAEKFYRGGKGIADVGGLGKEVREGAVKEGVVVALKGDGGLLKGILRGGEGVLVEMVEEGLVSEEQLVGLGVGG